MSRILGSPRGQGGMPVGGIRRHRGVSAGLTSRRQIMTKRVCGSSWRQFSSDTGTSGRSAMERSFSSEVSFATARMQSRNFPDTGVVVWYAPPVCLRTSARTKPSGCSGSRTSADVLNVAIPPPSRLPLVPGRQAPQPGTTAKSSLSRVRQTGGIPAPSASSSQAPDPCEWVPGLGWRSHRAATPGGRPRRGACELDNRKPRKMASAQHLPVLRVSHVDLRLLSGVGAPVPGGRPQAQSPVAGAPAAPRSGAAGSKNGANSATHHRCARVLAVAVRRRSVSVRDQAPGKRKGHLSVWRRWPLTCDFLSGPTTEL
jgi:hypothetical protein